MLNSLRRRIVGSAAALALLAGCGSDSSPLASGGKATPSDEGPVYLAFTAQALQAFGAAGKPAAIPSQGLTVSRLFKPKETASMEVKDLNGHGVRDDLVVAFIVKAGDLSKAATITMTVHGNQLSDLLLAFQPNGLVFDHPARLRVTIGAQRVDRSLLDLQALLLPFSDVEAYHEHDGAVEGARIISVKTYVRLPLLGDVETHDLLLYDYAVIDVEVPGFSRYGLT